ncbi:hypothetical protein MTR67_032842 [Solanum verrucosum]|uniref:Reverse transcriptase zinc-binding domain-containing protein n=1 Tax=Solanum verrucosum TaxID=315347 RepID=A0AAF0U4Z2_SOLVR|nr:hypothetical protein MTR67_032842 [Solanum verrucosum]
MSFPQCWNKTAEGVMEGEFQEKKKRKRRNRRRPQPPVWKVMHGQATKDETRMVKTKIPLEWKNLVTVEEFGPTALECSFCNNAMETVEHLFFDCSITKAIWTRLLIWLGYSRSIGDRKNELQWLNTQAKGTSGKGALISCGFVTLVALLWRERNKIRHQQLKAIPVRYDRKLPQSSPELCSCASSGSRHHASTDREKGITLQLWEMFLSKKDLNWVMPRKIDQTLKIWSSYANLSDHKDRWKIIPACIWWAAWTERNLRSIGKI